jgi:hypothetical protein
VLVTLSMLRTSCTDAEEIAKSWPPARNKMICSERSGCGLDGKAGRII